METSIICQFLINLLINGGRCVCSNRDKQVIDQDYQNTDPENALIGRAEGT